MDPIKVRKVGNSLGIVLSKEVAARLRVENGDELYVSETANGIQLSAYDPKFASQMDVAKSVMKKRRNLLHKLAE
jgi:putative addiction module antidote